MAWEKPESTERAPAATGEGKSFLAQAKEGHAELFRELVKTAYEFDSPVEYTAAVEEKAWAFAEKLAKASFVNGKQAAGMRRKKE